MCTFHFTQNVPDSQHISAYYQSTAYVSHSDTKEGLINRLYHLVRSITLQTKLRLVKKVTGITKGVLLDIGSGTGAFLNTMQKAGWHVTGLEPDPTARAIALQKYGVQLQNSEDLAILPQDYDAITLWHVLEHVHELHATLNRFHKLLKPAGRLLIAVPNFTSYDAQYYRQYWASWDVPRHLYHFSPKSFEVLLQAKGFQLEAIKPMWFDSFYVSMLSEQYKTGKNNFLRALFIGFTSNLKAIMNTKKCSSVIYVLKKQ